MTKHPSRNAAENDDWIDVGVVWVDTAQLLIIDPCHLVTERVTIDEVFEAALESDQPSGCQLGGRYGWLVPTGIGDGSYPVSVRLVDWGGEQRVAEVRVIFIGETDDGQLAQVHAERARTDE
jgi:hypothetical protein